MTNFFNAWDMQREYVDNSQPPETSKQEMKFRRTWCGPTVLLLLTGQKYETLKAQINRSRNKAGARQYRKGKMRPLKITNAVKGMSCARMRDMLDKYKFKPEHHAITGVSLKRFCFDMEFVKEKIVIVSGNHFLLLSNRKLYDTFTITGELPELHPYKNTRVEEYWILKNHKSDLFIQHTLDARLVPAAPEKVKKDIKPKKDIKQERYEKALSAFKKWQAKEKRAIAARKKWQAKVKRYEKIFAAGCN